MTTIVQVIGDALRLCGVIAEGQSVSPEQGLNANRALNQMMATWDESNLLGFFPQSDTTATIPIPDWAEQGVTSKLAQRLHADYPASQMPAWVHDNTLNGVGVIERKMVYEQLKPQDMSHLPSGSGHLAGTDYDIQTGS
jgi:hypothetical protein